MKLYCPYCGHFICERTSEYLKLYTKNFVIKTKHGYDVACKCGKTLELKDYKNNLKIKIKND